MNSKYILNDTGKPIRCDDLKVWTKFYEDMDKRQVNKTTVGPYSVSTVFLALDHSFGNGPPLLYETMVLGTGPCGSEIDNMTDRYTTRPGAQVGHRAMVGRVQRALIAIVETEGFKS